MASLLGNTVIAGADAPAWKQSQQAAVTLARSGDTPSALSSLGELYAAHSEDAALRNDYAVVAAWDGQDTLTDRLLSPVNPSSLPEHVLATYAKSQRNLQAWQHALFLYELLIERDNDKLDGYIAKVLVLADSDEFEAAETALEAIPNQFRMQPSSTAELDLACGYIAERQQRFTHALDCYNRGLRNDPTNRELRKRRVLVASVLGATGFAQKEMVADPTLLSPEEQIRLKLNAAATQVRWADLPAAKRTRVHAKLAVQTHQTINPVSQTNQRQLQYDHIVALSSADQMQDAAQEFEALLETTAWEEIPYYVLGAAGELYLYLEQGYLAERCYSTALANLPDSVDEDVRFNLEMGLFYALSDTQQFSDASALINQLQAGEAAWKRPTPNQWIANNRFAVSQEALAMSLAYREDFEGALREFDALLEIAPASVDLRLSKAAVNRWRGWYRRSAADLGKIHARSDFDRKSISQAHLALDVQEFARAENLIVLANERDPKEKAVIDLTKRWKIHQRPQLIIEARSAESDGTEVGSDSYDIDTHLYSAPIDHHFRLVLHDLYRYGKFDEGASRDHRIGAGLEYRDEFLTLNAELHRGLEDTEKTGVSLGADWQSSDHWYFDAEANYNSYNIPLRAGSNGITANDLQGGIAYRLHESSRLGLTSGVMDFDDGNLRKWLGSSFSHRLVNYPHHKLNSNVSVYFSENSIDTAPYFNPESDSELIVGLEHEWRAYQNYDRTLVQRISLSGGLYDQESFERDSLWRVRLGHTWEFSQRYQLSYGFEVSRRPYDGTQEQEESVFITLGSRL